jgi:phosphoribosyl-AMP cyclohydrolase
MDRNAWLDQVCWSDDGLVPAIAQDVKSGRLMMMAWMNQEALEATVVEGRAVYWSRSRRRLWRKGEQSGHEQKVREIRLDCDKDVVLLTIEQIGGIACHTGRESCFFYRLEHNEWIVTDLVIQLPEEIYKD